MFRTADKMPINPPPPPAGNSIIINAWGDCLQPMSCHSIETCLVVEHKEHCPVTARRWNTTTDESLLRADRPAGRKSSSHCYTRTISHWKSKIRSRPRSSSLSSISRMGGGREGEEQFPVTARRSYHSCTATTTNNSPHPKIPNHSLGPTSSPHQWSIFNWIFKGWLSAI